MGDARLVSDSSPYTTHVHAHLSIIITSAKAERGGSRSTVGTLKYVPVNAWVRSVCVTPRLFGGETLHL